MYLFIKKFWFHINLTQVINYTMKIIQYIENIHTIHNWYGKKHLIAIGFDFLMSLWLKFVCDVVSWYLCDVDHKLNNDFLN